MSNFLFLKNEWPDIYRECREAEKLTLTSPKASAVIARSALELTIRWLYQHDEDLEVPYDDSLNRLIHEQCFREILEPTMFREIDLIRLTGNQAAHGKRISQDQSIATIKNLFRFMSFLTISYAMDLIDVPPFSMAYIPDGRAEKESKQTIRELEQLLENRLKKQQDEAAELAKQAETIAGLKAELAAAKKANTKRREKREKTVDLKKAIPVLVSEAVTRKLYIDVLLKDAGWDQLTSGREIEYEVKGMPVSTNRTGIGYVDYVLWGKDGKPLAVIEAKRTMADARKGRHQAELYADCIEQMHGRRPVIFYTNGFETFIWDDTFYIDRQIHGFYTQEELQLLIDRRTTRKDLRKFTVNQEIAGRDYQIRAIQRVAENLVVTGKDGQLHGASRQSLLVMATGSGKTRTAVAIVEMLIKCNWAKRVLFLADRNALVTQAKNDFNTHLPELSAIDLTKNKEDDQTRLVFSTYPTIMNKIDSLKSGDQRFYGIGHFDLIIIDEAHRSVYQKYRAIFEYFDSLLIGLTATPKKDIDRNTYGLFGIEDDNPTFAYELNTAVQEKWLVPPKSISVPLKFQREGIRYADLSEVEKREYEEKFGDPTTEEAPPEAIGSAAINKWLFNTDTVDKVLDHLMTDGIKVSGGDKLGKTIIFAKNHSHAVFIEERFNKNYPEYGGHFLRVIDNYETKAQDLLEKFKYSLVEENPQIAVSVDMMDTGVNAPRVVNLVFFKLVKSVTKFWQMIGRGTRLFPDLFGPGEDKTEFLIFDYCQNFEFFDEHPDGAVAGNPRPLLQQIFISRLRVAQLVDQLENPTAGDLEIRTSYLDTLHRSISQLDESRFLVRKELRYVQEYRHKNRWLQLTKSDIQEINEHLSHLEPANRDDDELARRFDILILLYQIRLLTGTGDTAKYATRIAETARGLEKLSSIPQINAEMRLLGELQTEHYWETIDLKKLESVRVALRDLIKYLTKDTQKPVYTNFADELDLDGIVAHDLVDSYVDLKSYKDRVESYIRNNKNHLTIKKLSTNVAITTAELDELERLLFKEGVGGTREEFVREYGDRPLGAFVRSITGLDREAVQAAFSDFLQTGNLRADQMTFVKTIINYLTKNGTIDKTRLYESPFTDLHDQGISGIFKQEAELVKLVKIIDLINGNAEVG